MDLAEPLRILKNITYTIKLNMKGNSCFDGKDYKSVVKIDDDACCPEYCFDPNTMIP
jgi:hypothetical protein